MDGSRCVLVVDDDSAIRTLLVTFLRRRGFQSLEARNGREALEEMRAGRADAVLLDLMMPEVSGWDVLRERAADPSLVHIPIIVITANNVSDVRADLAGKDVCAVVAKPFDLERLVTILASCLSTGPAAAAA